MSCLARSAATMTNSNAFVSIDRLIMQASPENTRVQTGNRPVASFGEVWSSNPTATGQRQCSGKLPQYTRSASWPYDDGVSFYDFEVTTIDGATQRLDAYRDRTLLIVNVASQCGFTPQYAGLERLHRKYRGRGLAILAFPCDQFGPQEPGAEAAIKRFCSETYDVTFPLFSKIKVNGAGAHPLYAYLKVQKLGLLRSKAIKWNFTKFLVSAQGEVLKRYAPRTRPEQIDADLDALYRREGL